MANFPTQLAERKILRDIVFLQSEVKGLVDIKKRSGFLSSADSERLKQANDLLQKRLAERDKGKTSTLYTRKKDTA